MDDYKFDKLLNYKKERNKVGYPSKQFSNEFANLQLILYPETLNESSNKNKPYFNSQPRQRLVLSERISLNL